MVQEAGCGKTLLCTGFCPETGLPCFVGWGLTEVRAASVGRRITIDPIRDMSLYPCQGHRLLVLASFDDWPLIATQVR